MDHDFIEQHQIVDRYLMGRLPEEESARFEEHYLHCQACLDALEVAEKLRAGLQRTAAADAARSVQGLAVIAWLARLGRSRQIATLAGAFLVAALLPATFLYRELARERQPHVNVMSVSLDRVRDATAEPPVRFPLRPPDEWIQFSLPLTYPDQPRYRVVLIGPSDEEIWRDEGFVPDVDNYLRLSFPARRLAAGDYRFRVEGLPEGQDAVRVGEFLFRVTASE